MYEVILIQKTLIDVNVLYIVVYLFTHLIIKNNNFKLNNLIIFFLILKKDVINKNGGFGL